MRSATGGSSGSACAELGRGSSRRSLGANDSLLGSSDDKAHNLSAIRGKNLLSEDANTLKSLIE